MAFFSLHRLVAMRREEIEIEMEEKKRNEKFAYISPKASAGDHQVAPKIRQTRFDVGRFVCCLCARSLVVVKSKPLVALLF